MLGPGVFDRIESNGGRVCSGLMLDELATEPFGMYFQLLYRPGPESIGCCQNNTLSILLQPVRYLGNSGGLASPIDPYEGDDQWSIPLLK